MIFLSSSYLRGKNHEIVPKEIGVVRLHSNGVDIDVQCYLFQAPYDEGELSEKIKRTNEYMTARFHGIRWADGHIPPSILSTILSQVCTGEKEIYAKGTEQVKFFANQCSRFVMDLDTLGCAKAESIHVQQSFKCAFPHKNHCALTKALKYAEWMKIHLLARCFQDTLVL
jgi:hypothetical protein